MMSTADSVAEFKCAIEKALSYGELFTEKQHSDTTTIPIVGTVSSVEQELDWGDNMEHNDGFVFPPIEELEESIDMALEAEEYMLQGILISHAEHYVEEGEIISLDNVLTVAYLLGYKRVSIDLVSFMEYQITSIS